MESTLKTAEARHNLVCNAVKKAGEVTYTYGADSVGGEPEAEADINGDQFDALTELINSLNDVSNCGT